MASGTTVRQVSPASYWTIFQAPLALWQKLSWLSFLSSLCSVVNLALRHFAPWRSKLSVGVMVPPLVVFSFFHSTVLPSAVSFMAFWNAACSIWLSSALKRDIGVLSRKPRLAA